MMKKPYVIIVFVLLTIGVSWVFVNSWDAAASDTYETLLRKYYRNGSLDDSSKRLIAELGIKHGDELMLMVRYREGALASSFNKYVRGQVDLEYERHEMAFYGFYCLGTNGTRYLPELCKLFQDKRSDKLAIARCIGAIGEAGGKRLIKEIDNSDIEARQAAILGLIVLDNIPKEYMNKILSLSQDQNSALRSCVGRLCARHGKENEKAIAVLLRLLSDRDASVIETVIKSLYVNNWRNAEIINKMQSMVVGSSTEDIRMLLGKALKSMTNNETISLTR